MSAQAPTTPDPSRTMAHKVGAWVKIIQTIQPMEAHGFKVGGIVQIYNVVDANNTPQKWERLVSDTQYAIQRKAVSYTETKLTSPEGGFNMIPHSILRTQKNATTVAPTLLKARQEVWLTEERTFPMKGKAVTIPQGKVTIALGPMSTKGTDTSRGSNPALWFYVVEWIVRTPVVELTKFGTKLPAQLFSAVESREPPDPKL